MEIILHVGMGKTGTSSIQIALGRNAARLIEQGVDYLGLWFDGVDERFAGFSGQGAFFRSPPDEMRQHARSLVSTLRQRQEGNGCSRFILSNESMYSKAAALEPFVDELRQHATVRVIAYVRNPREWLPSAYTQWALYHKAGPGPVKPYPTVAAKLVRAYAAIETWAKLPFDVLTLREFHKRGNVVEDFTGLLGIGLDQPAARMLERTDIGETVLRGLYNNRLPESVLPLRFDRAFSGISFASVPTLAGFLETALCYNATEELVESQRHTFDFIRERFGIDLLAAEAAPPRIPPPEDIRNRLIDHMLHLVLNQADRIRSLETSVRRLQAARRPADTGAKTADARSA
ncbi:polysaccharide biosynthesis protein [Cereibacter sphaeroides]|uniref:polysaccharide biosynthesis protein n=1 Tax=Cereibacter sphaeroides TaxID=1063 RepID=UPI001F3EF1C8|nr:polysaccharide biosynthesis protein [Cereibacter sphaeroides]MCE6969896.1 polysaccharide biosynthesis protein [Cereibacter sphaeroides]